MSQSHPLVAILKVLWIIYSLYNDHDKQIFTLVLRHGLWPNYILFTSDTSDKKRQRVKSLFDGTLFACQIRSVYIVYLLYTFSPLHSRDMIWKTYCDHVSQAATLMGKSLENTLITTIRTQTGPRLLTARYPKSEPNSCHFAADACYCLER